MRDSLTYSMSRQFLPTPISTNSGTFSGWTCSICSRTSDRRISVSSSGASKTSSSCTWSSMRDFSFLSPSSAINADHGQLDQVGGGALQRRIDGGALGKPAHIGVLAQDVGNGTNAAEQRRHLLIAAGSFECLVNEAAHALVAFEIGVDVCLGFLGVNPQSLREPEGRESVHDAEVHHLGAAAMLGLHHQRRNAEDLRGGEGVDVVAAAEGVDQQRVVGEMRQQAELDLRIVGGEQHAAGLGDEGGANFAAEFGADGNVLQVRVLRRQPAGGGIRRVEGGVQAARAVVEQQWQRVHVSGFQLGELPVFQHQARDFVLGGQAFEHVHGGGDSFPFAVFHRLGQVELVEQNVAKLLGRVDVEFLSGKLVDLPRHRLAIAIQPLGHGGQHVAINLHAGIFHARQHGHQRKINFVVQLQQPGLLNFFAQCRGQAAGDVGGFRNRSGELHVELAQRNRGKLVVGVGRIEQVGVEHGVVLDAGELDAIRVFGPARERVHGGFGIVNRFRQPGIGERRLDPRSRCAAVE